MKKIVAIVTISAALVSCNKKDETAVKSDPKMTYASFGDKIPSGRCNLLQHIV